MLGLPPPLTLIQRVLFRIGFIRRNNDGSIRWPFYVAPRWHWQVMLFPKNGPYPYQRIGFFRNLPHVIDHVPGSWLPRRWGFFILGFEFGQRG